MRFHSTFRCALRPALALLSTLLPCMLPLSSAGAAWTITGTATREDGATGLTGVKVVLYPGEVETTTDDNGDFLLPWDGTRGYLTVQATGVDLCKRLALWPKEKTDADSTLDLGPVVALPTGRYFGQGKPVPPRGTYPPDSLQIAGPEAGKPDRYWMVFRIVTDIYGAPTAVDRFAGEEGPPALQAAVADWLKSVKWKVNRETACGLADPFRTMMPVTYWWRDGRWIFLPEGGPTKAQTLQMKTAGQRLDREVIANDPKADSTMKAQER